MSKKKIKSTKKDKKPVTKKVEKKEKKINKTKLILDMAKTGRTRKQIIEKLNSFNTATPKSNSGFVSKILGDNKLRNIPSGTTKGRSKRKIVVKSKKKK